MKDNPIDLNRLMWLGAGAGSKGLLAGIISGFAPQAGIAPDVASLLIGFLLATQGGERIGVFGEGMLIASVGQLVRQPIEGIFGKITQPAPPPVTSPKESSSSSSNPSNDVDTYLQAKYGIV